MADPVVSVPELVHQGSGRALVHQGSQKTFALAKLGSSAKQLIELTATPDKVLDKAALREKERLAALESAKNEAEELTSSSIPEIVDEFKSDQEKGLTSIEVASRQLQYGKNELDKDPPVPLWKLFLEQLSDLLVLLLLAACILSAILSQWAAALTIFIIIGLNACLGVWQEAKAGQALEALESMSSDKADVLRDGRLMSVDGKELVPGDIVMLSTGQKLPADVRLLTSNGIVCAEMALTGESEGVPKDATYMSNAAQKQADKASGKEAHLTSPNTVYMGCALIDGRGKGMVVRIGMGTRMGKIAKLLKEAEAGLSPLQEKLEKLGVRLGIASLMISVVVFVFGMIFQLTPDPNSILPLYLQLVLVAVSLTVAAVPEGLPAAVTITLAMGMRRMVTKGALIRNLHSVETLGSATVICSDKTGTLTAGVMTATKIHVAGVTLSVTGKAYDPVGQFSDSKGTEVPVSYDSPSPAVLLLTAGTLCSNATLQRTAAGTWECIGNTSDRSVVVLAAKGSISTDNVNKEYPRTKENPFSSVRKMMSVLVKNSTSTPSRFPSISQEPLEYIGVTKGAPNIVLALCNQQVQQSSPPNGSITLATLSSTDKDRILGVIDEMSSQALRVLAVAYKPIISKLDDDSSAAIETELIFLGLIASIDPERDEVIPSIRAAHSASVRVCMITGDYVKTAKAIAENINLIPRGAPADAALDCEIIRAIGTSIDAIEADLAVLLKSKETNNDNKKDIEEKKKILQDKLESEWCRLDAITSVADVYARAKPEDKITIVRSLQRQGHVVAMTGDGVNDAPALKQANIGVAMGITGTDVAKAAAAMVLTNDNFASIVLAIEEGRTIYANISKFVFYLLSSNIAEVLLMLFSMFLQLPIPLTAIQILWLNLATDGAPAIALAVENTDPGTMDRAPRLRTDALIDKFMVINIAFQAMLLCFLCICTYLIGLKHFGYVIWDANIKSDTESLKKAQTMVILLITTAELFRAHTCRSQRISLYSMGFFSNIYMHYSVGVAITLTYVLAVVPFGQKIFNMSYLDAEMYVLVIGVALIPSVAEELMKLFYRVTKYGERPKAERFMGVLKNAPRDAVAINVAPANRNVSIAENENRQILHKQQ